MENKRQVWIDYLKAIAIIMVVVGHSVNYYGMDKLNGIEKLLYSIMTTVHVPLFFWCSGYLCHKQPLLGYYKKKFFRIIIPFIIFVVFKLIYGIVISSEFVHSKTINGQVINAFITGSLYWFIYPIVIMYAIAPFFWEGEVKKRLYTIFFSLIIINTIIGLYEVNKIWDMEIFQLGKVLFFFVYFIAGMICRCNEVKIKNIRNKKLYAFFSILAVGGLAYGVFKEYHMNEFLTKVIIAFSLVFLLYLVVINVPENINMLKIVGRYSLQIYFFDSFFKVILFVIVGKIITINLFIAIIISIVNIALSCIACKIIEKIPYIKVLFGL